MPRPMGADLIGAGRYERVLIGRLGCYPIGGGMTRCGSVQAVFLRLGSTEAGRFASKSDICAGPRPRGTARQLRYLWGTASAVTAASGPPTSTR